MRVAFHSYQLGDRGTEICLYKYAKYNRELLGHESVIVSTNTRPTPSLPRFKDFPVFLYQDIWQNNKQNQTLRSTLEHFVAENKIDVFYAIKGGEDDDFLPRNCRSIAHCIFRMDEPHGDVYAGVCKYISDKHGGIHPYVYHIVETPIVEGDYRAQLGIPKDALVIGRHGGFETFNIGWVPPVVARVVQQRSDVYFVFLNTKPFAQHERIKHLPVTIDEIEKTQFVNTCDVMLHARADGEIFSLSTAEFSKQNKPIITWDGFDPAYDRGHIVTLGEKAIYYKDAQDLERILLSITRDEVKRGKWDAYGDTYSAKNVMQQFSDVFYKGMQ